MMCELYAHRYPQREGGNGSHNVVVYRTSDVKYDLQHSACSSVDSPRLRMIQVSSYHHTHTHTVFSQLNLGTRAIYSKLCGCG